MKLILAAVLAAGAAAVALPAAAESQWLASVEYAQSDFSKGGPNPGMVSAQVDYRSSHFWGIEAEGSSGVVENRNVDIGTEFAGYATVTVPAGSSVDLFARGGYGFLTARSAGINNANYWAAGVGAEFWLSKGLGIRADYTRQMFNKNVPDADVYAIGLSHKF
jgi:hypothetical protein